MHFIRKQNRRHSFLQPTKSCNMKLYLNMFVNGGSVTAAAAHDTSSWLPLKCVISGAKKKKIHQRSSALFLPKLTHSCFSPVDSYSLAYRTHFGRRMKPAFWNNSFWIKRFIFILDFAGGKIADLHTKPWSGHRWSIQIGPAPVCSVFRDQNTNKRVLWEIISVGNCWWLRNIHFKV